MKVLNFFVMQLDGFKEGRLYYSIGEVADMLGVSRSLIRFWDGEFEVLRPLKNSRGERRFTRENIELLGLIYELVRVRGFTLRGAKRELKLRKERVAKRQEALELLGRLRFFLEGLEGRLDERG